VGSEAFDASHTLVVRLRGTEPAFDDLALTGTVRQGRDRLSTHVEHDVFEEVTTDPIGKGDGRGVFCLCGRWLPVAQELKLKSEIALIWD
jgi:hypothetical protein